jgi:hypothetical protein
LTFIAYFTGGVRVWDIREPQAPVEVGFYVPVSNANTTAAGYMTNNVEVDNRGFVHAVDRNGAGLDILRVTGAAKRVAFRTIRIATKTTTERQSAASASHPSRAVASFPGRRLVDGALLRGSWPNQAPRRLGDSGRE